MFYRSLLVAFISLSFSLHGYASQNKTNQDFFENYDLFIPKNWQVLSYPHQGEITFLSPKHSCIIHINYNTDHFISKKDRYALANQYQKALSLSLSQTPKDAAGLKIAKPKANTLNTYEGYTFDYVNFFNDGRYLSGQSFLLFNNEAGSLAIDINSINYKTRKNCLSDAKKYIKTLKAK